MPLAGRQKLSNVPAGAQRRAARKSNAALRRGAGMSVNRAGVANKAAKAPAAPTKASGGRPGGGKAAKRPTNNVGGRPGRGRGPGGGAQGRRPGGRSPLAAAAGMMQGHPSMMGAIQQGNAGQMTKGPNAGPGGMRELFKGGARPSPWGGGGARPMPGMGSKFGGGGGMPPMGSGFRPPPGGPGGFGGRPGGGFQRY